MTATYAKEWPGTADVNAGAAPPPVPEGPTEAPRGVPPDADGTVSWASVLGR